MNKNDEQYPVKEIDLSFYISTFWNKRKIVIIFLFIGFALGLFIAFTTPKQYKSEAKLLVLSSSNSLPVSSLLQQFGGLAGMNVGNMHSTDIIKPEIYSSILQSPTFLLKLIQHPLYFTKYDTTITLENYYHSYAEKSAVSYILKYSIGLPSLIHKKSTLQNRTAKSDSTDKFILTTEQNQIIEDLKDRISIEYLPETEIINISVEFPDPYASTDLTKYIVQDLTNYIIGFKIQKATDDMFFIKKTCQAAEERYKIAQLNLATFRDKNKNVILAVYRSEEERLQAEYNAAFGMYNTLSQQLEQAKIKVQEQTPAFKLMGKYQIPTEKSKPKRILIIFMYVILGGIFSIGYIFGGNLCKRFYNRIFLASSK